MKQLKVIVKSFVVVTTMMSLLMLGACSKHKTTTPKRNIQLREFNQNLRTYTPQVVTESLEFSYWISYEELPTNLDCDLENLVSWKIAPNGYYLYFNNSAGAMLVSENGQRVRMKKAQLSATIHPEDGPQASWSVTIM